MAGDTLIIGFTVQVAELLRRNAALLGTSTAAMFETYEHRHLREQIEQTRHHGLLMGLTEEQIQEVVKAWEHHHLSTPFPIDWAAVRESLACRARGEEWKP